MAGQSQQPPRIKWNNVPVVYLPVYRAACPRCGGCEFEHVRSMGNGDGSATELAICLSCAGPYKIVREPQFPGSGNYEHDV